MSLLWYLASPQGHLLWALISDQSHITEQEDFRFTRLYIITGSPPWTLGNRDSKPAATTSHYVSGQKQCTKHRRLEETGIFSAY